MARAPKTYTRLTRNAAGLGSYASLWLAADHLLIVRSNGYTESYSRLQLHEIKGFFLTPSNRRAWWGIAWGVCTGVGALMLMSAIATGDNPVWSLIFLAPGLTGLLWNHSMGPGVRGYVVTGVQTAELPALRRLKKARATLARLQPLIEAAQADLALPPVIAQPPVATPAAPTPPAATPSDVAAPPVATQPPVETQTPPGANPPAG